MAAAAMALLFAWVHSIVAPSEAQVQGGQSRDKPSEFVLTNEMVDPDLWFQSKTFLDKDTGKLIDFWDGNYSDVARISCVNSTDLLFEWWKLKAAIAGWLSEVQTGSDYSMQIYWERLRPIQHAFTNVIAYHNFTDGTDCMIGVLAVRLFYITTQTREYREREVVARNSFVVDWHYLTHRFRWSDLVRSGWADVIFPSILLVSDAFERSSPWLKWRDCESLPGFERLSLPATMQDISSSLSAPGALEAILSAVNQAQQGDIRHCPATYAYVALLATLVDDTRSLQYLDAAQKFLRQYREANDFAFVNLLNIEWPLWHMLALAVQNVDHQKHVVSPQSPCNLVWCRDGGTPNPRTCRCEVLFPQPEPNVTVCIFMVDTRRTSSLRNISSLLGGRFWTLTYGLNRLYAEDHGYEIEYIKPDNDTHFPDRKVGWGKVKVLIDKLREYGPDRCAYGVSIDTDAFLRSSEPLSAVIYNYGLDKSKLILFSQEYHTEQRPDSTFINGGFFIVRNTAEGVGLVEEWYNVPDDYEDMRSLKKENPQGLNLCWDVKMHPRYHHLTVLAPPHLFTAPLGWFVRHNWWKDLNFEQEMREVLLQRLFHKYGCIMCDNVYDWDRSTNHDVGPLAKGLR